MGWGFTGSMEGGVVLFWVLHEKQQTHRASGPIRREQAAATGHRVHSGSQFSPPPQHGPEQGPIQVRKKRQNASTKHKNKMVSCCSLAQCCITPSLSLPRLVIEGARLPPLAKGGAHQAWMKWMSSPGQLPNRWPGCKSRTIPYRTSDTTRPLPPPLVGCHAMPCLVHHIASARVMYGTVSPEYGQSR